MLEKRTRQARQAPHAPTNQGRRSDGRDSDPRHRTRRGPGILDGHRARIALPALPAAHHPRAFPHRTARADRLARARLVRLRSEEHTSELQSLMRISYAVFCLKKKTYKLENIMQS